MDTDDIERKIMAFVLELHDKRVELAKLKSKYQESVLQIQDLELDLDREKRKLNETKIQLEVAIKASEKCETKRVTLREQVAVQMITADVAYKERDYLREQNRNLNGEVGRLKKDLEQSQVQVKDLLSSLDSFKEISSRNNAALENLNRKDGVKVKKILDKSKEFTRNALTLVSLQSDSLRRAIAQRETDKRQLYQLQGMLIEESSEKQRSKIDINKDQRELSLQNDQLNRMEQTYRNILKAKDEQLKNMESALSGSLDTYKSLQARHDQLKVIFKESEEELKQIKSSIKVDTCDVGVGTEPNDEPKERVEEEAEPSTDDLH